MLSLNLKEVITTSYINYLFFPKIVLLQFEYVRWIRFLAITICSGKTGC